MNKLKPCPFCGSEEISLFNAMGEHWVHCPNKCPRMRCCDTDAAESWNTRPIEDKLQAEIERSGSDIKQIGNEWQYWRDVCEEIKKLLTERNEYRINNYRFRPDSWADRGQQIEILKQELAAAMVEIKRLRAALTEAEALLDKAGEE